ncbi:MAG: dATP pyrophosphohydrolase [Chlorobi bacterium]|nr:dATP pyrophosphohydrolase [Chlorobiota bacterium]
MPGIVSNLVQVHPFRVRGGEIEHLLLKRASDEPICPDIWQVVTGGIETGERSIDAARRELLEETGIVAESWIALPVVASFYFEPTDEIMMSPIFACRLPDAMEPRLSEEHGEYRWLPLRDACALLPYPSHREGARAVEEHLSGLLPHR